MCYRVSWLCSVSCKEMHIGGPRSRKLVRHPPCLKCSATCSHCGIVCYLFIIAIYRPRGGDDESRLLMTLRTQENKNTRLLESSQSVKQEDRFQATLCSLQIAYPGETRSPASSEAKPPSKPQSRNLLTGSCLVRVCGI